jgi:YVTN family beta-propeller protein
MSYVVVAPEAVAAAAAEFAGIGSTVEVAGAATALSTTNLLAAGGDEVSAAVAALFGDYAQRYQALSAQAVAFHDQLVRLVTGAGGAYAGAEATNALSLQGLQQAVANVVNPPARALLGHPLIGQAAPASAAGSGAAPSAGASAGATTSASSAGGATSLAAQNPVTATVPAGTPGTMVVSPDGRFLYVTNLQGASSAVSVINTATKAVTSIPLGVTLSPDHILITPNGKEVYVSGQLISGGTTSDSVVVAINTANHTASSPIVVGSGYSDNPGNMVITPDGSRIYVDGYTGTGLPVANEVAVINTATHSVTGNILLDGPGSLVVSPNGGKVYVGTPGAIDVISTGSNTVTAAIPETGGSPQAGMVISPDGSHLYAEFNPQNISIIDTATNAVAGTISTPSYGLQFSGAAISPDSQHLYIPTITQDGNALLVFDTTTGGIGNPIALSNVQSLDQLLAQSPNGQYLYAANSHTGGTVTIIDTAHAVISDPITINPYGFLGGLTASGSTGFVADQYSSTVAMINPALATYHPLPSGTGFTGSTTPVVTPPPGPDPGPGGTNPPTGGGGGIGPGTIDDLVNSGLRGIGLPYGIDLSDALHPVENALSWVTGTGDLIYKTGKLLLGDGAFGPLALAGAAFDTYHLAGDLGSGNWAKAGLDGLNLTADLGRAALGFL